MRIVIPDAATVTNGDLSLDPLREFGELVLYPQTTAEELPQRLADADAVLCNKAVMDRRSLRLASRLRYIGLFAVFAAVWAEKRSNTANLPITTCARKRATIPGAKKTDLPMANVV